MNLIWHVGMFMPNRGTSLAYYYCIKLATCLTAFSERTGISKIILEQVGYPFSRKLQYQNKNNKIFIFSNGN
jgi:hypothetical protein